MPRKPNPNSTRYYFTQETEDAIVLYNNCDDPHERNGIFDSKIKYPLNKMAENLIHRFKFYQFDVPYEDVKHETVAHIIEKLTKYSPDKGKAFSYFSIVAKNYLINEHNGNYDAKKNAVDLVVVDDSRQVINEISRQDKIEDDKEFMDLFVDFVEANMASFVMSELNKKTQKTKLVKLFETQSDFIIVDSILELFKRRESIEVFNKKALYILIKERSGNDKTQDITKLVKRVEMLYKDTFLGWTRTGKIGSKYLLSYNYK